MNRHWKYVLAVVGAGAMIGVLASSAFAGSPQSPQPRVAAAAGSIKTTGCCVQVSGPLQAKNNLSVSGHFYAHNQAQVWGGVTIHTGDLVVPTAGLPVTGGGLNLTGGGLTVATGGVKADSLVVTNAAQVGGNLTVTGNLSAGTLQLTSLAVTGSTTVGSLTSSGQVAGNGVDAGNGGLTTKGNVTLNGPSSVLTAPSIATGSFTAGDFTATNGTVNLSNAKVNFTNAKFTGLDLSGSTLSNATITTLNVGSPASASAPLFLSANGKTAGIGVDTSGNLTIGSLVASGPIQTGAAATVGGSLTAGGNEILGGNLTVGGSGGIAAISLAAPNGQGNVPGQLALIGSTVQVNGALSVNNGSNLTLSPTSATSGHLLATGDADVAGIINVPVNQPSGGFASGTATYTYKTPYASAPVVVLTPADDPGVDSQAATPKYWVSSSTTTGFTVSYIEVDTSGATRSQINRPFYYHVIG